MGTNRYAGLRDGGRSEYGGDGDNLLDPNGQPRTLSTGERARALRMAGLRADEPAQQIDPGERLD